MNVHWPTLAVLIPTFNRRAFLHEAMASVAPQLRLQDRLVVVNDGSTDDTAEWLASAAAAQLGLAAEQLVVVTQANQGIGAARNAGLQHSDAEWLAFLDDDDRWSVDHMALLGAALAATPSLDLVFGHTAEFCDPPDIGDQALLASATRPRGLLCGAMLARRSAFARVGGFDPLLRGGEFVDWCARARDAGLSWAQLSAVVLHRRLHGDNSTRRSPAFVTDYPQILRAHLARRLHSPR